MTGLIIIALAVALLITHMRISWLQDEVRFRQHQIDSHESRIARLEDRR